MKRIFTLLIALALVVTISGSHSLLARDKMINLKAEASNQKINPVAKNYGITVNTIPFEKVPQNKLSEKLKKMVAEKKMELGYEYMIEQDGTIYLAIFAGQKPTGGYKVEVTNIEDNEGVTIVTVKESAPAKDAFVTMAITYPYTVVKFTGTTDQFKLVTVDGNQFGQGQIDQRKSKLIERFLEQDSIKSVDAERVKTLQMITDAWANRLAQLEEQLQDSTLATKEVEILEGERNYVRSQWKIFQDQLVDLMEKLDSDC